MPAALARAGLRCCDGQSVLIRGNSGGAVAGGTGTISARLPAARAHVWMSPPIVVGSAGPTA
jgi:hypothetical protein